MCRYGLKRVCVRTSPVFIPYPRRLRTSIVYQSFWIRFSTVAVAVRYGYDTVRSSSQFFYWIRLTVNLAFQLGKSSSLICMNFWWIKFGFQSLKICQTRVLWFHFILLMGTQTIGTYLDGSVATWTKQEFLGAAPVQAVDFLGMSIGDVLVGRACFLSEKRP